MEINQLIALFLAYCTAPWCPFTWFHSPAPCSCQGKSHSWHSFCYKSLFLPLAVTVTNVWKCWSVSKKQQTAQLGQNRWVNSKYGNTQLCTDPDYFDISIHVSHLWRAAKDKETSGTVPSVLTGGNGGPQWTANYTCRRQFSTIKTNEPPALKPAHKLVIFCHM